MLSQTLEDLTPAETSNRAPDPFVATVSEGLHTLAQPLTILRSTIALLASPKTPETARQRYLDLSTEQVQRACDLFETMQDLVIANQSEASRAPFAISQLISAATGDPRIGLAAPNVNVRAVAPAHLSPVLGDYARTLQALTAALTVAISLSAAGDSIDLRATPSDGSLRLTVGNPRTWETPLNSSQRLSLALAEANIRSQHGTFIFSEDPFAVSIELPFTA